MLRKLMMVTAAAAVVTLFNPHEASARGGFGGGFHGGFHGGGFHHGFGFAPGFAFGFGLGAPYYGYPYAYDPYYVDDGGYAGDCYLVRRRVATRHGWRLRTVQVCN